MNKLIAATAAMAFVAAPTLAQEMETYTEQQVADAQAAIEAAELSDDAYQNLWCGSAFLIVNQLATNQNMKAEADSAKANADVLFSKAATEAVTNGVSEADFNALAQNFRILAISQTGSGAEADYTQEECTAAAQAQ